MGNMTAVVVITLAALAAIGACVLLAVGVKALASLMDPHLWD